MDQFIFAIDRALQTLSGTSRSRRASPAVLAAADDRELPNHALSEADRRSSIGLMRVNHAGEVAAQALYQGQMFASRSLALREKLNHAADEELDHLAWTRDRVHALGGRTSLLDPLWYAGSFAIGAAAGAAGDRLSLGFLQATEEQVEAHLDSHLNRLPASDAASRAVVAQMRQDEANHAQTARTLGARELPMPVQALMRLGGKVMTTLSEKI